MSMAFPIAKDLIDEQEVILPCGLKTLFVAPKTIGASFDLIFNGNNNGCYGIKVPFSYDYPQPIKSMSASPSKVIAHGEVHLIYTT